VRVADLHVPKMPIPVQLANLAQPSGLRAATNVPGCEPGLVHDRGTARLIDKLGHTRPASAVTQLPVFRI